MKKNKPSWIIAFTLLVPFGVLIFILGSKINQIYVRQKQAATIPIQQEILATFDTQKESLGFPIRLKIPKINLVATIEYVGLTASEEMDIPKSTINVGWFALGPRPGEKGSAVIDGHFNGENGKPGVFANLYKLEKGDKLYIEDSKGQETTFSVSASRTYDPGYADDVFTLNDTAHLNLITCDGVWNESKKSYSKRLVVYTNIIY